MTTSGVSRAVSRLEAEHGVRLLHRSTHALSLTDEGEQLLDEARDVLRASERIALVLSQAADGGRTGRVRISAPPGFTRACLVPALPRLLDSHPEIQVEVHVSYDVVDLADEGVDLALRTGQLASIPGHVSQTLFSSPWCAYATPSYLVRRGTPASPGELAGHDRVGFRNGGTGRVSAWHFRDPTAGEGGGAVRYDAPPRLIFDDGSAAYDMARNGYGIVWAPEWLALDDLRDGRVVEVLAAWRCGEMLMSVVRRERRLTPQRVRLVIDFLREAAHGWQSR
jgi:DNA-binding transcriptional LysR family regulator